MKLSRLALLCSCLLVSTTAFTPPGRATCKSDISNASPSLLRRPQQTRLYYENPLDRAKREIDKIRDQVPQPVQDFTVKALEVIVNVRNLLLAFSAGAVLTAAVVIVPLVQEMEQLSQPVTLFETILSDLETAYVDEVDTTKLFETGMAAMLNSLDPYTEFENLQSAAELNESIDGRYGGVGLVISGSREENSKQGIKVASAMEGYAFDYGMRVGDRIVAVDDWQLKDDSTVEDVRNKLRGEPGTTVTIAFQRDGVDGLQTVSMPRTVVRVRDVKLATLLEPSKGIGYIQLTGFTNDAGREVRNAIRFLQQQAEDVSENGLQGLVLDLRGNPGGLLTSAVDVASLLVPNGSDIVSARGRGFPGILYKSRAEPILEAETKLAVLVNDNTASAAEIVSGAIQDLDVGIIVGSDRTFGKGLVQNVEELPYRTALKYTVAKYYTPSGRCIQGVNYKEGGGAKGESGQYVASKVEDKDRQVFYTKSGRVVKDGGGIEADYKVEAPKASALEVTLIRSGIFNEFASDWSKKHELSNNFEVDEDTYKSFQAFVQDKQRNGELKLDVLYSKSLDDLKKALVASGYKGSEKDLQLLQSSIVREVQKDFDRYRSDIKEDIGQSILARYLPESMLIERGVKLDRQVNAAVELLASGNKFETILAKGSAAERGSTNTMTLTENTDKEDSGIKVTLR